MAKSYAPSEMHLKCLRDLDTPDGWRFLGESDPPRSQTLPWRPFRRIFAFNFGLFAILFGFIFVGLESLAAVGMDGFREDLPYVVSIAVALGVLMALYVTHLYRKAWNDRARTLS